MVMLVGIRVVPTVVDRHETALSVGDRAAIATLAPRVDSAARVGLRVRTTAGFLATRVLSARLPSPQISLKR
jgi:hypothetical protein